MLDTFNDNKSAYKFAVSSTGWTIDARILDDGRNRDYNWDGIWYADAKQYDWGFVVEMKIPFKSIQYKKGATSWGVDFDRWIPEKSEDIYWCNYSEHEGLRISKFGKLVFSNDELPEISGLNLELYPVALAKTELLDNGKYKTTPHIGMDVFYNPSPQLTFALTANPDFAQIEADPFKFNISRYETYYSEQRPFFIEGSEIFTPEGRNSYNPLQIFYSRRIGEKLYNGSNVPLNLGGKIYGRLGTWEYGSLIASTEETNYSLDGEHYHIPQAFFGVARVKKQIYDNSSIGLLAVGKTDKDGNNNGAIDIDGSVRGSDWQVGYQAARSFTDSTQDFAFSTGMTKFARTWGVMIKGKYVGDNFNVDQVGYVPWRGTANLMFGAGPRWYFENGALRDVLFYAGGFLNYEKVDQYTDKGILFGTNFSFKKMWGFSIDIVKGVSKDLDVKYNSFSINGNVFVNSSSVWSFYSNVNYSKTYNFYRDYLGTFLSMSSSGSYLVYPFLKLGTSFHLWREGKPDGNIEELTLNARPYITVIPINNLKIRLFTDNLYLKSTDRMEHFFVGFYFAYNFSAKSWIYFTYNSLRDRSDDNSVTVTNLEQRLHVVSRDATIKIKYLYYF
jgi:hypothetical protein